MANKPRWGWVEIILVYLCITVIGYVVSFFSPKLTHISAGLGMGEAGYFLVVFFIQFIVTVLLVWFFAVVTTGAGWSDLGLKAASLKKFIQYGFLCGIGLIITVVLLGFVIKQFQPEIPPQYFEQILRSAHSLKVFLLIFAAGAILAPFSEELYYRGMIYPVFRQHLGPVWGALLAGLLFALVHFDLWRTIPLAIGGAGLCYIYEKTGSIWVSTL
ncbi:MAG: amino terminal protease family protein, partial [Firmicutes bacterium]|nr:amino terminal protease family protein [Bacillota bacterium]